MPDDLVERVAQQFSHLDHLNYEYGKQHTWNDYARAAIAVVLEEAAQVAARHHPGSIIGHEIAAAIRALVK